MSSEPEAKNAAGFSPKSNTPFTIQKELIQKYIPELGKRGLCRPLSNAYAEAAVAGLNPRHLLENDHAFYRAAGRLEMISNALIKKGVSEEDVSYLAFTPYTSLPETKTSVPAGKLNEMLDKALIENDHILAIVPAQEDGTAHEVYFGRIPNKKDGLEYCRFFDANLNRGERIAPCPELLQKFKKHLELNYPIDTRPSQFSAIPHPGRPKPHNY